MCIMCMRMNVCATVFQNNDYIRACVCVVCVYQHAYFTSI